MNRIILEEKVRTLQLLGEDDKAKALQQKIAQQFDLPTTARMQDKQAKDLQAKIAKDMKLYGDEEEEEKEKVAEDETNEGLWDNIHAKRKRGEAPAEKGDEDYPEKDAWEKAQKSEGLNENYHDTDWIPALESAFYASVKVDKESKCEPLYGGGSYVMIGYEAMINEPIGEMEGFILEGLQINGKFAEASVIVKINGQYQIHSNLMIQYNPADGFDDNVKKVMSALKKRVGQYMG